MKKTLILTLVVTIAILTLSLVSCDMWNNNPESDTGTNNGTGNNNTGTGILDTDKNSGNTSVGTVNKSIAVIAKGESHAFWQSVKAGAEDAGKKYGYKITYRGPVSESPKDIPSQMEMVQTALSNNAAGLVIATIGEGFSDMLKQAYDAKIPVVQFDSGVWANDIASLDKVSKNPIVASVATSNEKAAALAAENFYAAIKGDIEASQKYIVGVIQHDETQTGIDRAKGFVDKFTQLCESNESTKGKCVIEKEVKPGDAENAYKTALEALFEKGAAAIFMTNEGVVKQVYDAIGASGTKYDSIKFCGYDAGTKQIEWMRKTTGPKLVGAVAQDSYQIGYQAVEQCVFALEKKQVSPDVAISGTWWNSENVDDMIAKNLVYEG
ncbi:MAG: substrate-binding domain-containing protein [Clostridia bacterium]|nr:substrate-binding domain-containing protein [Clostridia bacterium]